MLAGLSACQQQDPQASGPAVQKEPAGQAAALADSLSKGIPFQDLSLIHLSYFLALPICAAILLKSPRSRPAAG